MSFDQRFLNTVVLVRGMVGKTASTECVYCGGTAIARNDAGQPTCSDHKSRSPKEVSCPVCEKPMEIRDGQYGYFWGCTGYPSCQVTEQIETMADQ